MSFFLETKQQSQATTVENLKSETGWEFTVLLIKKTECIYTTITNSNLTCHEAHRSNKDFEAMDNFH